MNLRMDAEPLTQAMVLRAILDTMPIQQRSAVLFAFVDRAEYLQAMVEASPAPDAFLHALIEARGDWLRVIAEGIIPGGLVGYVERQAAQLEAAGRAAANQPVGD